VDGLWIKRRREQSGCHRADHTGWNDVARKRRSRCRGHARRAVLSAGPGAGGVELNRGRGGQKGRKIAGHFRGRVYGDEAARWRMVEPLSLIVNEEKQFFPV